jgi:hypothetical protein
MRKHNAYQGNGGHDGRQTMAARLCPTPGSASCATIVLHVIRRSLAVAAPSGTPVRNVRRPMMLQTNNDLRDIYVAGKGTDSLFFSAAKKNPCLFSDFRTTSGAVGRPNWALSRPACLPQPVLV